MDPGVRQDDSWKFDTIAVGNNKLDYRQKPAGMTISSALAKHQTRPLGRIRTGRAHTAVLYAPRN